MAERPAGRLRRGARSVRFRVTALAALVTLVVLVITGVGLVVAQDRLLTENLEESIAQGVDSIAAALADGDEPTVLAGFGDDDSIAQVVDADGRVLASTRNVTGDPPIAAPPTDGQSQAQRTLDDPLGDGESFLAVSRRVEGPDGARVIHAAGTLEDIADSTAALATSLTVAIPIVVAILAALIWWLVGRTLRPVEAIRAEVADIGGSDLHRRVPEPATGDEIDRLASTMNAMLDRVERSALQQQRFVADASHELRSPLTRMRSELEVDLAHPENADLVATHRSVLDETVSMQHLVDDLLHLARSDSGAGLPRRDAVDLDDVALRHAAALRASGRVVVDTTGVAAAQVPGDVAQLTRAIGNVVDNAARHATGVVQLAVAEHDGTAVVIVTDDGPGIPDDQQDRIFDRFTRLDEARTAGTGGAGLGLSIARDIITRHGGTIAVDADHRPGARVVITLPR